MPDVLPCIVVPVLGARRFTLVDVTFLDSGGIRKFEASNEPAALMLDAPFVRITDGEIQEEQELHASDTTLAFSLPLAGRVLRTLLGSGPYIISPRTGFPTFHPDFVEKDDVFALSEHGTKGYQQEWRIDPDGTPVVVRAKPDRHMTAFATDGTRLFWTESYGSVDFGTPMAREV